MGAAATNTLVLVGLIALGLVIATMFVLPTLYYIEAFRAQPLPIEVILKGKRRTDAIRYVSDAAEKLRFKMMETAEDEIVFKTTYQRFLPGPVMRVSFADQREGAFVSISSLDQGYYGWRAAAVIGRRLVEELEQVNHDLDSRSE
jgi:hypothetical protein